MGPRFSLLSTMESSLAWTYFLEGILTLSIDLCQPVSPASVSSLHLFSRQYPFFDLVPELPGCRNSKKIWFQNLKKVCLHFSETSFDRLGFSTILSGRER